MDDIFGLEVSEKVALMLEGEQVDTVEILEFTSEGGVYARSVELDSLEEYPLFYFKKGEVLTISNAILTFEESGWYQVCPTTDEDDLDTDGVYFSGPYQFETALTRKSVQ